MVPWLSSSGALRYLLDAAGDAVAVLRAQSIERLEDHEIESAVGDLRSVAHQQEYAMASVESQQGSIVG